MINYTPYFYLHFGDKRVLLPLWLQNLIFSCTRSQDVDPARDCIAHEIKVYAYNNNNNNNDHKTHYEALGDLLSNYNLVQWLMSSKQDWISIIVVAQIWLWAAKWQNKNHKQWSEIHAYFSMKIFLIYYYQSIKYHNQNFHKILKKLCS